MVEITALEAKERLKKKLLEIEGVTGVGISTGSGPFLNIYVKKITDDLRESLPDEANGMPTRIIETGDINALPLAANEELPALDISRTIRMRPVRMGVSIGQIGVSAGTAGAVVRDNITGKLGILSNAHVLVDYPPSSTMENPEVRQPGVYDGGGTNDRIGETARWVPLKTTAEPNATNIVDCALCLPDNEADISSEILELGVPTGTDYAVQDMQVIKSGRSSGVTEATVLDTNADIKVGYGDFSAQFTDQVVCSPFGIPGDSVSYDSRMYWKENGKLCFGNIKELHKSFEKKKSIEIVSINKKDEKFPSIMKAGVVWSGVEDVIYHGIRPVYEITLHNGKRIKVTDDHSLMSVESFTSHMIPRTIETIKKVASVDNYQFDSKETSIDDDVLAFLGLWMADGCYIKKKGNIEGLMISTGKDNEIVGFLKIIAEKFKTDHKSYKIAMEFSKNINLNCKELSNRYSYDYTTVYKIRKMVRDGIFNFKKRTKIISHKSKGDYRIHSSELARIVHKHFGDVNSHTKRVPRDVFLTSNRQIGLFLKGYYSGDGSAHTGQRTVVECASVNRKLLEDVQVLLDRLGIKGNITSGYIPTELSKFRQYKLKTEGREHIEEFFKKVGLIKRVKKGFFDVLSKNRKKTKRPISSRGIRTMEYVGMEEVYDIKVRPSECFVSNGILCHNSGSAVLSKDSGRMVGLLYAGSDQITIFNKIQNVMSALNVSVAGATGVTPVQVGIGWLALPLIAGGAYYLYKGGKI